MYVCFVLSVEHDVILNVVSESGELYTSIIQQIFDCINSSCHISLICIVPV